ncbi:hypothetical protein L6259_03090 [Candidatus Parcubacteria bacterium]|nr:hypothetical protein [Patescibacteria group bacterium]MCG2694224.1 hypothetical protein [Candidatus Parcubacteria bacterium]
MGEFLGGKSRLAPMELYVAIVDSWERSLKISGDKGNGSYELSGVRGCVILDLYVSHEGILCLKVLRLADEKIENLSIQSGEDGKIGAPELIMAGILPPSGRYSAEPLEGAKRFLIDIALHLEIILERASQTSNDSSDTLPFIF